MSSSIPSWQILTAHAQPIRGARDLAFCLKVPLDSLLVWASSEGSGETARMRRLAWTFAARIGYKYPIRLTRSICYNLPHKWRGLTRSICYNLPHKCVTACPVFITTSFGILPNVVINSFAGLYIKARILVSIEYFLKLTLCEIGHVLQLGPPTVTTSSVVGTSFNSDPLLVWDTLSQV